MSNYDRKFKGVWIPAEIWLNEELSLLEKTLIVEIDSLSSTAKGCWASNNYFASFFQLSPSRISRAITKLRENGWVEVDYKMERKRCIERRIRVICSSKGGVLQKRNRGIAKTHGGYCKNASVSNILNNTKEGFLEIWEKQGFKSEELMIEFQKKEQFKSFGILDEKKNAKL